MRLPESDGEDLKGVGGGGGNNDRDPVDPDRDGDGSHSNVSLTSIEDTSQRASAVTSRPRSKTSVIQPNPLNGSTLGLTKS